jgi:hypothetical protein
MAYKSYWAGRQSEQIYNEPLVGSVTAGLARVWDTRRIQPGPVGCAGRLRTNDCFTLSLRIRGSPIKTTGQPNNEPSFNKHVIVLSAVNSANTNPTGG